MGYGTYLQLHFASLLLLLASIVLLLLVKGGRKAGMMLSGVAFVAVLATGFGLLEQRGEGLPIWAAAKLGILFVILGISHVAAKRMPQRGMLVFAVVLLLAVVAVGLAFSKPGSIVP